MPKNLTQKQIIIIAGAVLVVIIAAVVLFLGLRKGATGTTQSSLTIWGTDPQKVWADVLSPYTSAAGSKSGVQIVYTQIDPAQYKDKLLRAIAEGTGPDIFEIGNRSLPQWQNLLTPLPATAVPQFTLVTLNADFPTVVGQDFVSGGQIYALPFSIDTLAMIYNKDIFDTDGIASAPTTWDEFLADVSKLRIVNSSGQITQAAVALGGSDASIANASDILSFLMLQNGTHMTDSSFSNATFASDGGADGPGLAAFNFYLQFSNVGSPYYTWNDGMGDSLQSFIQGKTAIIFDYASSLAEIKAKAPFLNIGVAAAPQPTGATIFTSYPNYTGLAVSRSGRSAAAWNFILGLTTVPANEKVYTTDMGQAPALTSQLANDANDPVLSVFASQALTARSWHEFNDTTVDQIFNTAIQNVLNGSSDSTRALTEAQASVNSITSQ